MPHVPATSSRQLILGFALFMTALAVISALLCARGASPEKVGAGATAAAPTLQSSQPQAPGLDPASRSRPDRAVSPKHSDAELQLTDAEREAFDVGRMIYRVSGLGSRYARGVRSVTFSPGPLAFSLEIQQIVAKLDRDALPSRYEVLLVSPAPSALPEWASLRVGSPLTSTVERWEKRGRVGVRSTTIDMSVHFTTEPRYEETLFLIVLADQVEAYRERWAVAPRVAELTPISHALGPDGNVRANPNGSIRAQVAIHSFSFRKLECSLWTVDGLALSVHDIHATLDDMTLGTSRPDSDVAALTGTLSVTVLHHPSETVGRLQLVLEDAEGRRVLRDCEP